MSATLHPAPYSESILEALAAMLPAEGLVLDPFAGTGRIHRLATATRKTVGVEIEKPWADVHPDTIQGNALELPFGDGTFDVVTTSPCYGNRNSDSHRAKDGSVRRSYTHDLRRMTGDEERKLHPENAGTLYAWQDAYWAFHHRAWQEVARVLRPGGLFLLNVSDCLRTVRGKQEVVPIVAGHRAMVLGLGFKFQAERSILTPRMRYGANGGARVLGEKILSFQKGASTRDA